MAENLFTDLPPEIAQEYQALQRRRAIADLIAKNSMQPIQPMEAKGRFTAPISPLQMVSQVLGAKLSRDNQEQGDKALADLSSKYHQRSAEELAKYTQTMKGSPAVPPNPLDVQQAMEGGIPEPTGTPAVPGNPRKAVTDALMSPYLRKNPIVASDLKEMQEDKNRKIIQGEDEVHQERQPDGTWKEVGRGPRFAKQVGPVVNMPQPVTPVTIQDPKNPNKTIIVDGRSGKKIGDGPKLTETGKMEAKRQFNMQGIGKTIQEAENLLNGVVVEDGVTKSVPTPTGSGIGTAVDYVGGIFGKSPAGSVQAQQMKAIGGALTSKMPRMEGPQSDKDTALYKEMAAMIGDSTVPVERRKAALQTVKDLWAKYERLNPDAFEGGASGSNGWSIKPIP